MLRQAERKNYLRMELILIPFKFEDDHSFFIVVNMYG
jgi:hypothetical protein